MADTDNDKSKNLQDSEPRADSRTDDQIKKWEMASAARIRPIVPGLCLGNVKATNNREMLANHHITAIVSLTDARWAWWNGNTREAGIPQHRHKWVQCVDSSWQDLLVYMGDICDFIDQMASPLLANSHCLPGGETDQPDTTLNDSSTPSVLVHCDLGISRSPTVIIAYLMRKYNLNLEEVLRYVQTKQRVKPSANLSRQLKVWQEVGFNVWEDRENGVAKAPYQAFLDDRAAILKKKGLTGDEPLAPLNL